MGLLDGRVVIVTGAGRGLGRDHALELARAGATVVVNDLNVGVGGDRVDAPSPVEEVVSEIEAMGGTAVANGDSVSDWNAMEALVADTVDQFGDLHGVVNNAGILRDRMVFSMTEDDFDIVIDVHLKGTFNLLRHACSYWRQRAKAGQPVSGRVVNTSSGTGLFGNIGQSNYGAAKAGIVSLTTIAALEMDRYGVTVNAISPIAATRMTATAGLVEPAEVEAAWDPGDPANASPVVAWLCSKEAGWVTGQVFRIDGHTVMKVEPFSVGATYRSTEGEALTVDELTSGMRRLYGSYPPVPPQRVS